MTKRVALLAAALMALSVGACKEIDPDVEPPREALEGVPVVPLSVVVSRGGTAEVARSEFYTIFPPDTSAAFYRQRLIEGGWDIQSDVKSPDGRITIHAVRDGPPLWVILQPVEGREGTQYTIMGAVPDRRQLREAEERSQN